MFFSLKYLEFTLIFILYKTLFYSLEYFLALLECLLIDQETGVQSKLSHTEDTKNCTWCLLA